MGWVGAQSYIPDDILVSSRKDLPCGQHQNYCYKGFKYEDRGFLIADTNKFVFTTEPSYMET